ncbi:hypothetical protein [Streptomyces sp. BA2]|uniref:hypothetical protein n=1 Tax=Streptomyces sp. BA2 TaxID=436595 RepID=UPI0013214F7D|nr:hypothetical protein [Streptomyces sp. BA2]MWA12583.1 hypothetical protein [Streptomyces sp. BA2]
MTDAERLLNGIRAGRVWAKSEADRHRMAATAGSKREPNAELAVAYIAIGQVLDKIIESAQSD